MNSRILVRDFMKPLTVAFKPDTSVEEVAKKLVQKHVGGGPVLSSSGELVGYVTQQDCIREMLNDSYYCEAHAVAEGIMSREILSVGPDEDILKLAQMLIDNKPKSYPVVEDGRVIGVITRTDILKALSINRERACRT